MHRGDQPEAGGSCRQVRRIIRAVCDAFHCIEHAPNRIPEFVTGETAERVADLMRQFLLPHALAFYGGILGLSNDHDRLANVAGYILAHRKDHLSNRDVQASCRTMRKLEQRDTRAVFEQLEALGWLSQIAGPRPSSPPQWLVNPRVHRNLPNAQRRRSSGGRRFRQSSSTSRAEEWQMRFVGTVASARATADVANTRKKEPNSICFDAASNFVSKSPCCPDDG